MLSFRTAFILLLLSFTLCSCNQRNYAWNNRGSFPQNPSQLFKHTDLREENKDLQYTEGRKIIYSASMGVTVHTPDTSLQRMADIAQAAGGYVESVHNDMITVRIPMTALESSMSSAAELGTLDYSNMDAQDVTNTYIDRSIHLENAEAARLRYLELLDLATTVEEVLLVEKELERLNTAIDLLTGEVAGIAERVALASLTIKFYERKKLGLLGYVGKGLYHSVKWLFVRN